MYVAYKSTYSWFKVNLTEFANVWSSSVKENDDLLGSENDPCSITPDNSAKTEFITIQGKQQIIEPTNLANKFYNDYHNKNFC